MPNASTYSLKSLPLLAGTNSILVVPLAGQDAPVVQSKAAGALTSNTIGLMQTFARQSVLAIQNARLFREIDRKGRELAKAHDTVQRQADKLKEQTEQLESWNRLLEERVATHRSVGSIEIRQGVAERDMVVSRAGAFLRDGDRVTPVVEDDSGK